MIVKIDHLAMAAVFGPGKSLLEGLGYSLKAEQADLETETIKDGMLAGSYRNHKLALFGSPNGLGIELLSHVGAAGVPAYMLPICENPPQGLFEFTPAAFHLEDRRLRLGKALAGTAEVLGFESESGRTGIGDVWLDVPFKEGSGRFWDCLGFKRTDPDADVPVVEFRSPLSPRACRLYFGGGRFSDGRPNVPMLDDPGFNCMALISSSPLREKQALEAHGFAPTATARLTVDGKPLEVFFVRGPSGELVEVVGLVR